MEREGKAGRRTIGKAEAGQGTGAARGARLLDQRALEEHRAGRPAFARHAALGLEADRERGHGAHVGFAGRQPQARRAVEHAQRARRAARRQGPQLQRLVGAFAEAAHALQHQLALLRIEGHEHRGRVLVVGQHRHVLHRGCIQQLVAQVQADRDREHRGQRAGRGRAAPQREAAEPAARWLALLGGSGSFALAGQRELGLLGVDHVADAGPHGRIGHDRALQLGHAGQAALPDQRGGAHRRLFAREGLEAAARAAAQGANHVARGQQLQQFGMGGEFHGGATFSAPTRSVPCRRAVSPGRAGSRS
jgi:hypothetical protein